VASRLLSDRGGDRGWQAGAGAGTLQENCFFSLPLIIYIIETPPPPPPPKIYLPFDIICLRRYRLVLCL